MSDALELAAWRFLAAHRVEGLSVTHVTFTDAPAPNVAHIATPSAGSFYAVAQGSTFGEVAIELALSLGMPWDTDCLAEPIVSAQDSSSVATATRQDGAQELSSPPTSSEPATSTTVAIGVASDTENPDAR